MDRIKMKAQQTAGFNKPHISYCIDERAQDVLENLPRHGLQIALQKVWVALGANQPSLTLSIYKERGDTKSMEKR